MHRYRIKLKPVTNCKGERWAVWTLRVIIWMVSHVIDPRHTSARMDEASR